MPSHLKKRNCRGKDAGELAAVSISKHLQAPKYRPPTSYHIPHQQRAQAVKEIRLVASNVLMNEKCSFMELQALLKDIDLEYPPVNVHKAATHELAVSVVTIDD